MQCRWRAVMVLCFFVVSLVIVNAGGAVASNPVQIDILSPRYGLWVSYDEVPAKIRVKVYDANDEPISGAQVGVVLTLPDGTLLGEGNLPETDEKGVYSNELGTLNQGSVFGVYTLTVTVSGMYQGEQTHSFEVFNRLQVVERYDFRVEALQDFYIGRRGEAYAESQGDASLELSSRGANSVLIYRKTGQIPVEVEAFTELLTDINWGAYEMDTVVEDFEFIEFDGRAALQLSGYWTQEDFGKGPFLAVGLQCDDYFFVIQAANNGALYANLLNIMNSFHYVGE